MAVGDGPIDNDGFTRNSISCGDGNEFPTLDDSFSGFGNDSSSPKTNNIQMHSETDANDAFENIETNVFTQANNTGSTPASDMPNMFGDDEWNDVGDAGKS